MAAPDSSVLEPRTLDELHTPAAVVDLDRLTANLDRMAAYARRHGLALRPHTKTHKSPWIAGMQVERGAAGLTVATAREAEVMASVTDDLLVAYPPVGRARIDALLAVADRTRVTVALDSLEALDAIATAAAGAGLEIGVLVELDVGMRRCGVTVPEEAVALAGVAASRAGVAYRGVMFYPGRVREPVTEQGPALERLSADLGRFLDALDAVGLPPAIVSGGSTPTAFASHRIAGVTEVRPGTYVFNDRTTAAIGACAWEDCAYTVLATVVSVAVPGQAVVDAGSKALSREEIRAPNATGFGALLDRPDVVVAAMSEEHGVLDLSRTSWRPAVGDRVRIVPNHVCVSVNLQDRIWGVRGDTIETEWPVAARGWIAGEAAARAATR